MPYHTEEDRARGGYAVDLGPPPPVAPEPTPEPTEADIRRYVDPETGEVIYYTVDEFGKMQVLGRGDLPKEPRAPPQRPPDPISVARLQLDYWKAEVQAGRTPWEDALDQWKVEVEVAKEERRAWQERYGLEFRRWEIEEQARQKQVTERERRRELFTREILPNLLPIGAAEQIPLLKGLKLPTMSMAGFIGPEVAAAQPMPQMQPMPPLPTFQPPPIPELPPLPALTL